MVNMLIDNKHDEENGAEWECLGAQVDGARVEIVSNFLLG